MKTTCIIIVFILVLFPGLCFAQQAHMSDVESLLMKVKWLGQSSLQIKTTEQTIYFDPWQLNTVSSADIIFITHSHQDHLSLDDLTRITKVDTLIVTNQEVAAKLPPNYNVKVVKVGDRLTIKGLEVKVVPAYNLTKDYHPKANGWCGYVVTIDGVRLYHAGDTDFIPEMEKIVTDVAFLPIGGKYTMDAKEAAEAAQAIKPQVAVPFHYGKVVGSLADARRFIAAYRGIARMFRTSN